MNKNNTTIPTELSQGHKVRVFDEDWKSLWKGIILKNTENEIIIALKSWDIRNSKKQIFSYQHIKNNTENKNYNLLDKSWLFYDDEFNFIEKHKEKLNELIGEENVNTMKNLFNTWSQKFLENESKLIDTFKGSKLYNIISNNNMMFSMSEYISHIRKKFFLDHINNFIDILENAKIKEPLHGGRSRSRWEVWEWFFGGVYGRFDV